MAVGSVGAKKQNPLFYMILKLVQVRHLAGVSERTVNSADNIYRVTQHGIQTFGSALPYPIKANFICACLLVETSESFFEIWGV